MTAVLISGQVLDGRYEIVAPLAEGGMGAVYRAKRTLLGDEVAIKIIRPDFGGPGVRERFMRESRACAALRHPNIVSILDFNVDAEGRPYLVMELLNGRSLRDELADRGRLDVPEVQHIVAEVAAALQLAHRRGIVHRDLKPGNIVAHDFGSGERVYKIVDFGLANVRESNDETRLTAAHQFVGTISYASPEQLTGGIVDARSDIYSLGAVVFELLTGRVPFEGTDPLSMVTGHLTGTVPRLSTLREDIPPPIDLAVGRALAKSPDDRWSSMAEFAAAIGSPRTASAAATPPPSILSAYEVGERLGSGRFGTDVFRGVHRALGHPVAIRILRREGRQNWDAIRERFLREARTMQIAHPSIIQVRDYGEDRNTVYVVTDLIEGPSLRDVISSEGPLAWPRLVPLVAQLVEAARALHRRKGLLCGLHPEIIRLAPGGSADDEGERLMISTAGIWQPQDLLATLADATLRGTGLAEMEPRYVAPELLTGRSADVRSDVFTMSVLTYEMATAKRPYDGGSMPELLGAMLRGKPADPQELQPQIPERAASALLKGLAPSPDDRFASAKEFGGQFLDRTIG